MTAPDRSKAASICECGHERVAHLRERLICYADEGDCGCVEYRESSAAKKRNYSAAWSASPDHAGRLRLLKAYGVFTFLWLYAGGRRRVSI